jgi:hypothetical protein
MVAAAHPHKQLSQSREISLLVLGAAITEGHGSEDEPVSGVSLRGKPGEAKTSWDSAKQVFKILRTIPGIRGNRAHGERIDRLLSGYRQSHMPVGHNDMLALSQNDEAGLLEGTHGLVGASARYSGHGVKRLRCVQ